MSQTQIIGNNRNGLAFQRPLANREVTGRLTLHPTHRLGIPSYSSQARRLMILVYGMGAIGMVALFLTISGCEEGDHADEMAQLASETVAHQSTLNTAVANATHEVAETSKELVAQEAAARRDFLEAQQLLQSDKAQLERQQGLLATERQDFLKQLNRQAGSVQAATVLAEATVTGLPLVLIGWLLYLALYSTEANNSADQIALQQLLGEQKLGYFDDSPVGSNRPIRRHPKRLPGRSHIM